MTDDAAGHLMRAMLNPEHPPGPPYVHVYRPSDPPGLHGWLEARVDEDDRIAGEIGYVTTTIYTGDPDKPTVISDGGRRRHRALTEVAFKRAILARHFDDGDGWCAGCGEGDAPSGRCRVLLGMAAIYGGYPGDQPPSMTVSETGAPDA